MNQLPTNPLSSKQLTAGGAFLVAIVMFILAPVFVPKLQSWFNPTPVASVTPIPAVNSSPGTTPTLTPSQQAQAVITHYYSDINNRDYHDAYNLLGPAMQLQQSYNNFVAGYAYTLEDSVTISNIVPQSDGTMIVTLALTATEHTSSGPGTQVSSYQGTDTVGQVNGAWIILSGNFQKIG